MWHVRFTTRPNRWWIKSWKTPVWAFHGEADEVVPFSNSREMVDILRGMGNDEVKFLVKR